VLIDPVDGYQLQQNAGLALDADLAVELNAKLTGSHLVLKCEATQTCILKLKTQSWTRSVF